MATPNKESLISTLTGMSLKERLFVKLSEIHQKNGLKANDEYPAMSSELLTHTDAVEKFWIPLYEEVKCGSVPQMSDQMAKFFLLLAIDEKDNKCAKAKQILNHISNDKSLTFPYHFWTKVLDGRFTVKINPALKVWMLLNFQSPGIAIMEMAIFQYWYKMQNCQELTLDDFGMRMFPNGLFRDITWEVLWDYQKIETGHSIDNILDKRVPMQSLIEC